MTILPMINAPICSLPDPSRRMQELWGSQEEHNGDRGPYSHDVTPFFDNNTAAGWVKAAMKLHNPILLCIVYCCQQADARACGRTPMHGGRSFLPLPDILPPPAEDMIKDFRQESSDDGDSCRAQFQEASRQWKQACNSVNGRFKRVLLGRGDALKSSETALLVPLAITSQTLLLMRIQLGYMSMITFWILPLQAHWPVGSVQAAAQVQMSHCEDGMHWVDSYSRICVAGGNLSDTLKGGQTGDNLDLFGEVLGHFLVFCVFYYYIIHIHAWKAVFRVHDVGINRWDICFWERDGGSNRTLCVAII